MKIRTIAVARINPAPYNPRIELRPGDPEYEKLRRSMEEFGYVEPLVWNSRTGHLVGGHQRFKVLRAQGARSVDVKANEPELLQGTRVLWPAQMGYQLLMQTRVRDGRISFATEMQNEPTDPEARVFRDEDWRVGAKRSSAWRVRSTPSRNWSTMWSAS